MLSSRPRSILYALCALSLAACGPAPGNTPAPTSSPTATAEPSAQPSAQAPTTADVLVKLRADAALAAFATQQESGFALCLSRIASAKTRLSLSGELPAALRSALTGAGVEIGSEGGRTLLSLNSSLDLRRLLDGFELRFVPVPVGSVEGRTSFFDAAGLELGFVSWQAEVGAGSSTVEVTLSPAGTPTAGESCPRLNATVTGASLRGAGGQLSSASPTPSPTPGSSAPSPTPAAGEVPGVPTGLQIVEEGETYLTLQWDFPAEARSFKLYLDGKEVAANHVTPNYYRFEGLRASTNYKLGLRAVSASGESALVDLSGTTLAEGQRSASGNFSSGGNGNTSPSNDASESIIRQVNDDDFGGDDSDVAIDPDGNYVVVWEREYEYNDGDILLPAIMAQRFKPDGRPQGEAIEVIADSDNNITTRHYESPAVAMDSDGDFTVVWMADETPNSNRYGIQAQRFDRTGEPDGEVIQVASFTSRQFKGADIAMDGDGDFVVVWSDYASYERVLGRLFSGDQGGSEIPLAQHASNHHSYPAVAMDADGNWVAAWQRGQSDADVMARRFDPEGSPIDPIEFMVNAESVHVAEDISVDLNDDGKFVVAWSGKLVSETFRIQNDPFGDSQIFAQRFDGVEAQGENIQVNETEVGSQGLPDVGIDADGAFAVAWTRPSFIDDQFMPEVLGQRFSARGSFRGESFRISKPADEDLVSFKSALAMSPDGHLAACWTSHDEDDSAVFTRSYSPE